MTYRFNTIVLVFAAVFGGCVVAPDTDLNDFPIAVAYREAFGAMYGDSPSCNAYWEQTSLVLADLTEVLSTCGAEHTGCYQHTYVNRDAFIMVPYNLDTDQIFIHELTHLLLRCTEGDTDDDHSGPAWTWSELWEQEYQLNWSAISVLKEAE